MGQETLEGEDAPNGGIKVGVAFAAGIGKAVRRGDPPHIGKAQIPAVRPDADGIAAEIVLLRLANRVVPLVVDDEDLDGSVS